MVNCVGCNEEKYTVEYIEDKVLVGNYCKDCMCCPRCGKVLPPSRLGFMYESIGFQTGNMHIPAKYCVTCMQEEF